MIDMENDEVTTLGTYKLQAALRERFATPEYALFFEVADATGFAKSRSADAVAMSCWPSRGLELIGFELKVSRSDWSRELGNPAKGEAIARYCDRWYLVLGDRKILKEGELPPTWGLIVPKGSSVIISKEAPKLEPTPVDRKFLAAILRNACEANPDKRAMDEAVKRASYDGIEAGKKIAIDKSEADLKRLREQVDVLQWSIKEFEACSGIQITRWDAGKIGDAVKFVLNGGINSAESSIRRAENAAHDILRIVEQYREVKT